ncbi:MAG: response regulator [Ignavibacteriales bacterium]|nr:response regulator [Ignavibacteriales bacterium]
MTTNNSVRKSLARLLQSVDYEVETYSSAEEYLARERFQGIGCILLDVNLTGMSGLKLQEVLLNKFPQHLPIIFITGKGNVPMSVSALKKGAVNFLLKPFEDKQLLDAIDEAIKLCGDTKKESDEKLRMKLLIDKLTPREFEIFRYILTGMLNKQIAAELNIAEPTVKIHRGNIMHKLGINSAAEMVRIAERLGIPLP